MKRLVGRIGLPVAAVAATILAVWNLAKASDRVSYPRVDENMNDEEIFLLGKPRQALVNEIMKKELEIRQIDAIEKTIKVRSSSQPEGQDMSSATGIIVFNPPPETQTTDSNLHPCSTRVAIATRTESLRATRNETKPRPPPRRRPKARPSRTAPPPATA